MTSVRGLRRGGGVLDVDDGFRRVVEEHGPAVRAFVRTRMSDRDRADDVAQEVFLRAWRSADSFDPARAELRTWLFTIARNLVVDSYRSDARRPRTVHDDVALAGAVAPDRTDHAGEALAMAEALQRLSAAHRDVLVCLYYRGWSLAQTAAHLQVPIGTVKSRSTYALRALRLVLEEMEALP